MADGNNWEQIFEGDHEDSSETVSDGVDGLEIDDPDETVIDRYASDTDVDDDVPDAVSPDTDAPAIDPPDQPDTDATAPTIPEDTAEFDLGDQYGKATFGELKQAAINAKSIQAAATRKFQEASQLRKDSDERLERAESRLQEIVSDPDKLAEWLEQSVPPQVRLAYLQRAARQAQERPDDYTEQAFTHRQQKWEIEQERAKIERERKEFEQRQQAENERLTNEATQRIQLLLDNTIPTALKEAGLPDNASVAFLKPYLANVIDYYQKQGHRIDENLIRHSAKQLTNIKDVNDYLTSIGYKKQSTPAEQYKQTPPAASQPPQKRKLSPNQLFDKIFG